MTYSLHFRTYHIRVSNRVKQRCPTPYFNHTLTASELPHDRDIEQAFGPIVADQTHSGVREIQCVKRIHPWEHLTVVRIAAK